MDEMKPFYKYGGYLETISELIVNIKNKLLFDCEFGFDEAGFEILTLYWYADEDHR